MHDPKPEDLIPLKDIVIPPGYLIPEFRKTAKLQPEVDIFSFRHKSVEQVILDSVKAHIRDCPESIQSTEPDRFAIALYFTLCITIELFTLLSIFPREFVRDTLKSSEVSHVSHQC